MPRVSSSEDGDGKWNVPSYCYSNNQVGFCMVHFAKGRRKESGRESDRRDKIWSEVYRKSEYIMKGRALTYVGPGRGGFSLPYNMGDGEDVVSWCTLGFPQGDASFPTW
jgi:hypothetical protein